MKKIEGKDKNGNVGFFAASYNPKCSFDMASCMIDEASHLGISMYQLEEFMEFIFWEHHMTDFGKKIIKAIKLIHRGIPLGNYGQEDLNYYKEYYIWLLKNNKDMKDANRCINKQKKDYPEMDYTLPKEIQKVE